MKNKYIKYEIMACKDEVYKPFITEDYKALIKNKLDPEGWQIVSVNKITIENIIRRRV